MTEKQRLVIFDVDGTLVDSQADIVASMRYAFETAGLLPPERAKILSIVGLSLDQAMQRLAPDATGDTQMRMVEWYKDAYMQLRAEVGAAQSSPLYPGALTALQKLRAQPGVLLGVATGKSRRGLDKLLEAHDLGAFFVTQQVSDHHPSKPHPSMILTCLNETMVDPEAAIMIGDTSFDMDMAKSAGIGAIGVSWGYHPVGALGAADEIIDDFAHLPSTLDMFWSNQK